MAKFTEELGENINELLDIHELSAYLVPGSILIGGLIFVYQNVQKVVLQNTNIFSLIFLLIIAYTLGHVIQSVGNIIEKIVAFFFGDLKKKIIYIDKNNKRERLDISSLYAKENAKKDYKIKRFKAHGKLRLGTAVALLFILVLGWQNASLNFGNFYMTIIIGFLFITLLRFMRRAEDREIDQVLKYVNDPK